MKLAEKILLLFSRKPEDTDYSIGQNEQTVDNVIITLKGIFPDILQSIQGKSILDFGCGAGHYVVSMANSGAKYVIGIENNKRVLSEAKKLSKKYNVSHKVEFKEVIEESDKNKFDMIISINSMEHFANPENVLFELKSALKPNGKLFIKFEPPWYAPYGSHTYYFTKLPWVNIIFSEKTVMNVRAHFRNDGATKYEDIEGGLNKMTVKKFEKIIAGSGMKVENKEYKGVKGFDCLCKIPFIRELFVNRISCILVKKEVVDK